MVGVEVCNSSKYCAVEVVPHGDDRRSSAVNALELDFVPALLRKKISSVNSRSCMERLKYPYKFKYKSTSCIIYWYLTIDI